MNCMKLINMETYTVYDALSEPYLSDITIIIDTQNGEKRLFASKALLSSVEYFRNIFRDWADKKEIRLNNYYETMTGQNIIFCDEILEDFIKLIYSLSSCSSNLFVLYLKDKYATMSLKYILDFILIADYYQLGDVICSVIKDLISDNTLKINDYREESEMFNEFIISVNPILLRNEKLYELFSTILSNYVAQCVFGPRLLYSINNKLWTDSIREICKLMLLQYFDITDQASINTILSCLNDPERTTLKFYLIKIPHDSRQFLKHCGVLRDIFLELSDKEIGDFCNIFGMDPYIISKNQLADMLFQDYRNNGKIDIDVFKTKIMDKSLEEFLLDTWKEFVTITQYMQEIENKQKKSRPRSDSSSEDSDEDDD
jgi:hypothetical protein